MNLTTTPWIPVIQKDGTKVLVSLFNLFSKGKEIRDLAVNPPRRIALMRFLICVVQAALDGPEDEAHWIKCSENIGEEAIEYLKKWKDRFDLYGATPFMQIPGLGVKEGNEKDAIKPLGTLSFQSPYGGSNTPLFDRQSTMPNASVTETEIPLNLLTVMSFSTGGKVGQSQWEKNQYNHSTFAAPCIKAIHTFVLGKNIIETLHWNLLCKTGSLCGVDHLPNGKWGRPVWEDFPETPNDNRAWDNAFKTYLGRLVPLSRLVSITSDQCILGPVPKEFTIEHLPQFREATTTVIMNKKGESYYFSVSSTKHVWRDLGALLARGKNSMEAAGAVVLGRVERYSDRFSEQTVEIWTGGLETGATAAKLSDMVEWRLSLPLDMFNSSKLAIYDKGVALAQNGESRLKDAVKEWTKDQKQLLAQSPWKTANRLYWSILDNLYSVLVQAISGQTSLEEQWYRQVRFAMEKAYAQSCGHTTARQIRAFARGREKLRLKKPEA